MPLVKVGIALTINTGDFNNFKPEIHFEVDTDKDIPEQIEACVEATREVTNAVVGEMENLLDREGMKEFESTVQGMKKSLSAVERRVGDMEVVFEKDLEGFVKGVIAETEQDKVYDAE